MTDKTNTALTGNDTPQDMVDVRVLSTLFSQQNLTHYINSTSREKLGDEHMYTVPRYGLLDLAYRLGYKDEKARGEFLQLLRLIDDEDEVINADIPAAQAKRQRIFGMGASFSGHANEDKNSEDVARFKSNAEAFDMAKLILGRIQALPDLEFTGSSLGSKQLRAAIGTQSVQITATIIATVFPLTTLNGNRTLAVYDYDKKYYTFDTVLLSDAIVAMDGQLPTNRLKTVLETLEASPGLHYRTLDMPTYMIPVKNGNYNMLTEKLEPATFEYATTSRIATPFIKDAKEPKHYSGMTFENFISTFCDGHVLRKKLVKQMFASVIMGTAPRDGAFIINGPGGDGKSTLVGLLENVLGTENVAYLNFRDILEQDRLNTAVNARLIVGSDNDGKLYVNQTSSLKTLITHETQTLSRKYLSAINFKYDGMMIQLTNNLPRFSETGTSMRRRLIGIEAKHSFVKNNDADRSIDTWITDKEVHKYVLYSILTDKTILQSQYHACDQDMINESLDNDSSIDSFIKDLIRVPHFNVVKFIPASHFYTVYTNWSAKNDAGRTALSKAGFTSQVKTMMTELGFRWEDSNETIRQMMDTTGYTYSAWGPFLTPDAKTALYGTENDPADGYVLSAGLDRIKNFYRRQSLPEAISKFVYFKLGTLGKNLIDFYHKNDNGKYIKGSITEDKTPYLKRLQVELRKGNKNKLSDKLNNDVEETTLSLSSYNSVKNMLHETTESSIELLISDRSEEDRLKNRKEIYRYGTKIVQEIAKLYILDKIEAGQLTAAEATKNKDVLAKLREEIPSHPENILEITSVSEFLKVFRSAALNKRRSKDSVKLVDKFISKNPTDLKNSILTTARLLKEIIIADEELEFTVPEGVGPYVSTVESLKILKDKLDSDLVEKEDEEQNYLNTLNGEQHD